MSSESSTGLFPVLTSMYEKIPSEYYVSWMRDLMDLYNENRLEAEITPFRKDATEKTKEINALVEKNLQQRDMYQYINEGTRSN